MASLARGVITVVLARLSPVPHDGASFHARDGIALEPSTFPSGPVREVNLGDALGHLVAQALDQSPAPQLDGVPWTQWGCFSSPDSSRSSSKGHATSLHAPSTKLCGPEVGRV